MLNRPHPILYRDLIKNALLEDLGHGDVTTNAIIPEGLLGEAEIRTKEELVLCGLEVAKEVFSFLDPEIEFDPLFVDGVRVSAGDPVAKVRGKVASILQGERVALNFLLHLSGIATYTRNLVDRVKDLPVRVVDTRKTTPGLRVLEKYAVTVGGGANHRFGLYDGVIIKDNHLKACGSVTVALKRAKKNLSHVYRIEVEVSSLEELKEALAAGAELILLDNMDLETMRQAVKMVKETNPEVLVEASGGVTPENVREIAETGVDLISVGRLTHSAPAADLHLELVRVF
ncbi:MAG: carboxylating nicotinate-nucleotide diphosphorylase [Thermodesulfobacteria bacterium]|nr:carboxylating nicotinate-nucleotide diphosphorylase [Thermodesulfobacteriota bacterium]